MSKEKLFPKEDFDHFRGWLLLNVESISWRNRYKKEFEDFWSLVFTPGFSFEQILIRFEYFEKKKWVGPVLSWLFWLKKRFLIYCFVYKDFTVYELSQETGFDCGEVGTILRDYFTEQLPHYEERWAILFQVVNRISPSLHLKFESVEKELEISRENLSGSYPEEVMGHLEVTLYDQWRKVVKQAKQDLINPELGLNTLRKNASIIFQLKMLRDLILLLVVAGSLIFLVRYGSIYYEKYLEDKISIFKLKDIDSYRGSTIKTSGNSEDANESFHLQASDLEELDETEIVQRLEPENSEQFETESDVMVISWDALPKDFHIADLELSEYEEKRQGGYRDFYHANKKVYRVMVNSVDTFGVKKKIDFLLKKYAVEQVDNVKPGMAVPGGLYYNLYVNRERLKEFLTQVNDIEGASLYESRTRRFNPPGKRRVFVWIKEI